MHYKKEKSRKRTNKETKGKKKKNKKNKEYLNIYYVEDFHKFLAYLLLARTWSFIAGPSYERQRYTQSSRLTVCPYRFIYRVFNTIHIANEVMSRSLFNRCTLTKKNHGNKSDTLSIKSIFKVFTTYYKEKISKLTRVNV